MEGVVRRRGAPFLGVLLLAVGILLLLGNLGYLEYDLGDLIRDWWPAILLLLGLGHLLRGQWQSGIVLLLIGGAFLIATLDLLDRNTFRRWWPLGLVALGGWMVYRFFRPGGPRVEKTGGDAVIDPAESFRVFQMLGGSDRVFTSTSLRGGEATALMGGVEIDLRQATLATGGARVAVTAIMGGVVLKVPQHWDVVIEGAPLLGGIADKRPANPPTAPERAPRLEVRATVLAGGLEIR